jgi:hypothetical protein
VRDDGVHCSISGGRGRGVGVFDARRHAAPEELRGLFGAAPSVALATLGITVYMHGAGYAARQTWAMTAGAVALAVYGGAVCHLLMRARFRVASATLVAVVVWLVVAFGLLAVAGGLT